MRPPAGFERPYSIYSALEAQRQGHLTSLQLVEDCLQRIEKWDSQLHAWVQVEAEAARTQAMTADQERQAGRPLRPLHGIPVGIKDILDLEGLPTKLGMSQAAQVRPATQDAAIVRSLREAGAIILGKTVTTQFACFDPPATQNPWNETQTPGGSSSGSAVAVATGMCLAAIGSQTGGSITRPATYCGVAGYKPTFGRFSREGVFPVSDSLDHVGPICIDTRDLRLVAEAIPEVVGFGVGDSKLAAVRDSATPPTGGQAEDRPISLGLLTGFFRENADVGSLKILEAQLSRFPAQLQVVEVADPLEMRNIIRDHRTLMAYEMADTHEQHLEWEPEWLNGSRALINEGRGIHRDVWRQACESQSECQQAVDALWNNSLAEFDALLTLAAPGPAPGSDSTGPPIFNAPWSFLGLPTVSFCIGTTRDDLPVGVQLVGRRADDDRLLEVACICESNWPSDS